MPTPKAQIAIDHQAARFRGWESMLLEGIDKAEQILDTLEQYRESTARSKQAWQARADRTQGATGKRVAAQKCHELDSRLRKAERRFEKNFRRTRQELRNYLAEKKRFQEQLEALETQDESVGAEGGGTTLLGTLGQAVFAWRVSNAMDDLAKISGRKISGKSS